jgi:hypothetical protein
MQPSLSKIVFLVFLAKLNHEKLSYLSILAKGEWNTKKASWTFKSFEKLWKEEQKKNQKLSAEGKELFERYKNSYIFEYQDIGKKEKNEDLSFGTFVVTPFKVNNELMLNFIPLEYETEDINNLAAQHILNTNSVCLVEFTNDKSIKLKWLTEDVVSKLIENQNLKIKHEKTGVNNEDLILTANSKELYRFLEKFLASNIEDKWEKDQTYTLSKNNERS